jgi:hypothetical protein
MNLKFSVVAEREVEAAADYYETQEAGLGLQFVEELNHATHLSFNSQMRGRRFRNDLVVLPAALSLPCPLFGTTRDRNDRNCGSSAS